MCIDDRIVVYGTGENAIKYCKDNTNKIIGFLDGIRKSGFFLGKPILTEELVVSSSIKKIVIAATVESTKIIVNRIRKWCIDNGIRVYNMYDVEICCTNSSKIYIPSNLEEIFRYIDSYDVVSFDIFDTLLLRNTLYPEDVFDIVEDRIKEKIPAKHFKKYRLYAERETYNIEHSLNSIYDFLKKIYKWSDDECEYVRNTEMRVEESVIGSREDVVKCFYYALNSGKQVYLVTDMYLNKKELEKLLKQHGIEGYHDIFISGEYHSGKDAKLYKFYKERTNGNHYIHIGDNYFRDGVSANYFGIDSVIIKSSRELVQETKMGGIISYLNNCNDRSIIGIIISKIFNSPFARIDNERIYEKDLESFCYIHEAPLVLSFMLWFLEEIKCQSPDKVLFVSRDGYLPMKLYNMLSCKLYNGDMPESCYIYASRNSIIKAGLNDENMINDACNIYGDDYIKRVFKTDTKDNILKQVSVYKDYYKDYFNRMGLNNNEKYVFFELYSQGTIQYYMEQILGCHMEGVYLCNYLGKIKQYLDIKSYLFRNMNSLILESVITDIVPSVDYIYKNKVVFDSQEWSQAEKDNIIKGQSFITSFIEYFVENMYIKKMDISTKIIERLFDCYKDSVIIDKSIFSMYKFFDPMTNATINVIEIGDNANE